LLTPPAVAPLRSRRLAFPIWSARKRSLLQCPAAFSRQAVFAGAILVVALATTPAGAQSAGAAAAPHKPSAAVGDLTPDGGVPDRIVPSGKRSTVAIVWDCALPNYAPVVAARVEHGSVAIGTGNGPNCGHPQMSQTEVFYTPTPGFKGIDKLTVLGFLTHGNIDQSYTILVK